MRGEFMGIFRHKYVNKISKHKVSKKKVKLKPINKIEKPGKYLQDIIEKRYLFISVILVIFFIIIGIKLHKIHISHIKKQFVKQWLKDNVNKLNKKKP